MSVSPEGRIEDVLVTQIGPLSYITTNSIAVRAISDFSKEKAGSFVNVDVQKAERLEPNYNYYRSNVELVCETHIPNDENDTVGDALYNAVNNYVQGLSVSTLNTAVTDSDITIDGLVPGQNDEYVEENFRVSSIAFELFYTYSQLWTPNYLSAIGWYDSNDASTITSAGGYLSSWADKSGSVNTVSAATTGAQPAYVANAVTFDGTDDLLSTSGSIGTGDDWTIIALWEHSADENAAAVFVGTSDLNAAVYAGYATVTPYDEQYVGFIPGNTAAQTATAQSINTPVLDVVTASDGGDLNLYHNGTAGTPSTGITWDVTSGVLYIGGNTGTLNLDGVIYEVIVCDSVLSTADRQKAEGYLAWKWDGINGNSNLVTALPVDHPYKSAAPTA